MIMLHFTSLFALSYNRNQVVVLVILMALFTNFFYFSNWNVTIAGRLWNLTYILLILFYFAYYRRKNQSMHFSRIVTFLAFFPFLSSISSYTEFGQSFISSIPVLLSGATWIVYFLLHKYKVGEASILQSFLIISLIILFLQVIQQFTYPQAYFGVYSEEKISQFTGTMEKVDIRNGLYRFRIAINGFFTCPVLFYLWISVRKRVNLSNIITIILLLVSLYLTLTRQVFVSCIATFVLSFLFGKNRSNISIYVIGISLASIIYVYSDNLFLAFEELTKEDSHEDNIRILCARFYIEKIVKNPLVFLIGYGKPAATGEFAVLFYKWQSIMGFHTVDIGFIGQIFHFGVIYVIAIYHLLIKLLFFTKGVPPYIRLFIIYTTLMSVMIFPVTAPVTYFIWSILLYICDLYINNSPLLLKSSSKIRFLKLTK